MGKRIENLVADQPLDYVEANANELHLCAGEPTTFAEATSTKSLGSVAMAGGDFTVGEGDSGGRKLDVASKSVTTGSGGDWDHVALVDTGTSDFLLASTVALTTVTAAQQVETGGWSYSIDDPS